MKTKLEKLSQNLEGELNFDELHKAIYATDASVYRRIPLAVAFPKTKEDIKVLCAFAKAENTTLIPRTAGTSLAGQCVGEGIIVDVSKYFTSVIDISASRQRVIVQPGVIRDELNRSLADHHLMFGPNTSTSNRCMIGGMVGNNSSGTTSISYGTTRDKLHSVKMILWDGSEALFESLNESEINEKLKLQTLEGDIYRQILSLTSSEEVKAEIRSQFPKEGIGRRNTGYALDELIGGMSMDSQQFPLNLSHLIAGSEGTLGFITEITLDLDRIPNLERSMVAVHFKSISQCMKAVAPLMKERPVTCEMMDRTILECTKNNKSQLENRFFVQGDPEAILLIEVESPQEETTHEAALRVINSLKAGNHGYCYPILTGGEINQALELRKAGLGLLGNIVGDRKAVACIEDTAVLVEDLEAYIAEFTELMTDFGQEAVYYAHAGAGEIHLRPILNLKVQEDVTLFRQITEGVVALVKKYGGSLSGEHGDGIVRSEFLEKMIGSKNYNLCRKIKHLFDPHNIFNSGKIVDPFPMDESFRYEVDRREPEIDTFLNFNDNQGILRLAEKCNGSGDCRKLPAAGGVMCPSYRATRDEKDTTRARANALREFLTTSDTDNKYNHSELKEVFDLCLSCKACASECPSNVDVATLKAEFEYQYQKSNGSSLRTKLFAHTTKLNKIGAIFPIGYNALLSLTGSITKRSLGIARNRSLPQVRVFKEGDNAFAKAKKKPIKKVILYIDEFTQYLDGDVGEDAHFLLKQLNYEVEVIKNRESGRAYISKGFLKQAKVLAEKNVKEFRKTVSEIPILGIEPSAILSFRDEYLRMVENQDAASELSNRSFLIEEFLDNEVEIGNIGPDQFTSKVEALKIHGHCHQKALSSISHTFNILNIPKNYKPTIIPSGCCGMAGSFGYEKEHYEVSMKIGEQTLFPAVNKASLETIIVANGTSCRHQIKDGTSRKALHPITVMRQALVD